LLSAVQSSIDALLSGDPVVLLDRLFKAMTAHRSSLRNRNGANIEVFFNCLMREVRKLSAKEGPDQNACRRLIESFKLVSFGRITGARLSRDIANTFEEENNRKVVILMLSCQRRKRSNIQRIYRGYHLKSFARFLPGKPLNHYSSKFKTAWGEENLKNSTDSQRSPIHSYLFPEQWDLRVR
jgi:hypothetical protein